MKQFKTTEIRILISTLLVYILLLGVLSGSFTQYVKVELAAMTQVDFEEDGDLEKFELKDLSEARIINKNYLVNGLVSTSDLGRCFIKTRYVETQTPPPKQV